MSDLFHDMTDRLLDSFAEVGGINHIDCMNLPSKHAAAEMTARLLHLMFPGFYDDDPLKGQQLDQVIHHQVRELYSVLETQILKSLEFAPPEGRTIEDYSEEAARITTEFLKRLPTIRERLSTDVEAAYDGDPAAKSLEEIILSYPGIEAIAVHRLAHELHLLGVTLIPRMMTEWAHTRTGIDIHPGATIGTHFFIDHGTGVVVGETCSIGNHVKIYHGVTLGARSTSGGQQLRGRKRHPTIEDDVTIYPGATILGGETVIGRGSTVGGNVFLLQSVPKDHLVVNEETSILMLPKENLGATKAIDFEI